MLRGGVPCPGTPARTDRSPPLGVPPSVPVLPHHRGSPLSSPSTPQMGSGPRDLWLLEMPDAGPLSLQALLGVTQRGVRDRKASAQSCAGHCLVSSLVSSRGREGEMCLLVSAWGPSWGLPISVMGATVFRGPTGVTQHVTSDSQAEPAVCVCISVSAPCARVFVCLYVSVCAGDQVPVCTYLHVPASVSVLMTTCVSVCVYLSVTVHVCVCLSVCMYADTQGWEFSCGQWMPSLALVPSAVEAQTQELLEPFPIKSCVVFQLGRHTYCFLGCWGSEFVGCFWLC